MTVQDLLNVPNITKAPLNVDGADAGQCTAVPHKWEQMLGLPLVLGNAIDTWVNAPASEYDKALNTPEGIPQPGAILVYEANNAVIGTGPYGHTGVVVSANVNNLSVFEQNDEPNGMFPHVQYRPNYDGVYGWFYPKVLDLPPVTAPAPAPAPDPLQATVNNLTAQVSTLSAELIAANAQAANMQTQNATLQAKIAELEAAAEALAPATVPIPQQQLQAAPLAPAASTPTLAGLAKPGVTTPGVVQPVPVTVKPPAPPVDPALNAQQKVNLGLSQVAGEFNKIRLIIFGNGNKE